MKKGFVLVELLIAAFLFSLVSALLYGGFVQSTKIRARIQEQTRIDNAWNLFSLRIEKDLRNAANLKDFPFEGRKDRITFPVFYQTTLYLVSYRFENGNVEREQRKLDASVMTSKTMMTSVANFEFRFPYKDVEKRIDFQSFWLDEPYAGLPRGVSIELQFKNHPPFEKTISLPHGKFGFQK